MSKIFQIRGLWPKFPECLGIICLVPDAFIPLTVCGIINLSVICFPLHPYTTAGKTVVYISLTFVLFETSKSVFCRFKYRSTLSGLFLMHFISSLMSSCFQPVHSCHLHLLWCLFFISLFPYLLPYHLFLPFLYFIHSVD
jgi:hypothetical protein